MEKVYKVTKRVKVFSWIQYESRVGTFVKRYKLSPFEVGTRLAKYTTTILDNNKVHETVTLADARLSIRVLQLEVFRKGNFIIEEIGMGMLQKIAFEASYSAVSSGRKTGGVDGLRPDYYRADLRRLEALSREVLEWLVEQAHSYYSKCRMCPIPKKDGTIRMLSVPNISDNARLNCLLTLISPLAERAYQAAWDQSDKRFLVSGSRTGFGVGTAVAGLKLIHRRIGRSYRSHIIFCDIASCFPSIPHELVKHILLKLNVPAWVTSEILKASRVFMIDNPQQIGDNMGLPQGNPASPLVCNLVVTYLLAEYVVENKIGVVTYLDDLAIVCPEGTCPQQVLYHISGCLDRYMNMKVGMKLKPSKTEIITGQRRVTARWLGMDVWLRPSDKWKSKATSVRFLYPRGSIANIMSKCNKVLTRQKWKLDPIYLARKWQPIILGSCNYFKLFKGKVNFERILLKRLMWRLTIYYLKSKRKYSSQAFYDLLVIVIFSKLKYKASAKNFDSPLVKTLDQ